APAVVHAAAGAGGTARTRTGTGAFSRADARPRAHTGPCTGPVARGRPVVHSRGTAGRPRARTGAFAHRRTPAAHGTGAGNDRGAFTDRRAAGGAARAASTGVPS